MTHRGRLIVLEGPDGVGKSTLARAVAQRLRERGVEKVHELSFPAGAKRSLGQVIYKLHHDPASFDIEPPDPTALQALHVAGHIDTIENAIRPALDAGEWVVLDRYWWSTWAYGMAYGVPAESVNAMIDLERLHWREVTPDVVLLIDRATPFRAESDAQGYATLRQLYQQLERQEQGNVAVRKFTNDGTLNDTIAQCMDVIAPLLEACPCAHGHGEASQ